jgi:hypothetical protein
MRTRVLVLLAAVSLGLSACAGGTNIPRVSGATAANLRRPGNDAALRRRILADGPIFMKGAGTTKSYWLTIVHWGEFSKSGELIALFPHVAGQPCRLEPRRAKDQAIFLDDAACTGGSYNVADLQKYQLTTAADGRVTVDTSQRQLVVPAD